LFLTTCLIVGVIYVPTTSILLSSSLSDCVVYQQNKIEISDDLLLSKIINCESGDNPNAQNPYSSAKGLCQMIDSTEAYVESHIGEIDWDSYESQYNACLWLLKNQGTSPWGTASSGWGTYWCFSR